MRQKWKKSFKGIKSYHMLQDGRQLALQNTGDSLFLMEPATKKMRLLSRVSSYQVIGKGDKEWLCYEGGDDARGTRRLTINCTSKIKEFLVDSVMDRWFNEQGDVMIVKKKMKDGTPASYTWEWHNLDNGVVGKIWDGDVMGRRSMDQTGRRLVFSIPTQGSAGFELRYYKEGMAEAEPRIVDGSPGIDSSLRFDNYVLQLSRDGKQVFFSMAPKSMIRPSRSGVHGDVWSYRARLVEQAQVNSVNDYVSYLGWMNVETGKARLLEKNGMHIYALEFDKHLD